MNKGGLRVHLRNFPKTRLQMLQSEIFWSFICVFFFLFRSNSVFSGAVRSYAKDIDVFEKVGDRAKLGLQRKGGPGPRGPPLEIKKKNYITDRAIRIILELYL